MDNHKKGEVKPKLNLLKTGTALMFLLALVVLGSLFIQQQKATRGQYDQAKQNKVDPVIEEKLTQARIAKAQVLRAKWQSWALQHKAELLRMRREPNNVAAWQPIYEGAIGATHPQTGFITAMELNQGVSPFSWHWRAKQGVRASSPQVQKKIEDILKERPERLAKMVADNKDLRISDSVNSGPVTVELWASGRITKRTIVPNPDTRSGQPSFIQKTEQVQPPYQFLG